MALKQLLVLVVLNYVSAGDVCPKQCDCDMTDGLARAVCADQNIINIDVGVPKEVQVYSLTHNSISELDNKCFKEIGYTSVQVLNLSYNVIFWIGLHAFAGLDKLVHLDLSYNRLRYIPSDLFWDTPQLENVDLSGNVFEALKNEPFLMHSKLQVLNLNNCRIKSLPDRLFTRLPNLRKLDLSENYMVSINLEVLRPIRRLERIELKNDYWTCDPSFIAIETWISSRGITYEKQCRPKVAKMSEKMISVVQVEREDVDIAQVWNITTTNVTAVAPAEDPPKTPFEKFDKDFSAFQAFIIGMEIGLAIGIVGTYVWLRSLCSCGQLACARPAARGGRRAADRTSLLLAGDSPVSSRRGLVLPERAARFPYGGGVDAVRLPDRAETPPPPYHECRINI